MKYEIGALYWLYTQKKQIKFRILSEYKADRQKYYVDQFDKECFVDTKHSILCIGFYQLLEIGKYKSHMLPVFLYDNKVIYKIDEKQIFYKRILKKHDK